MTTRRPAGAEAVRAVLQQYADRGVFRGLSERTWRTGLTFRFTWLTRDAMRVAYEPTAETVSFVNVLPAVTRASSLLATVEELVRQQSARSRPAHRRIDRRRAEVSCVHRRGAVSVVVRVTGANHAYAVTRGVNLIHEIFLLLREHYPEYLAEVFGMGGE